MSESKEPKFTFRAMESEDVYFSILASLIAVTVIIVALGLIVLDYKKTVLKLDRLEQIELRLKEIE